MANSYSAGDLYLNIDTFATDTLKNLDAVIQRLNIINTNLSSISRNSKLSSLKLKEDNIFGVPNVSRTRTNGTSWDFFKFGRWTAILHVAKQLGNTVADLVTAGSNYTETLNLWQVAMRENLDMAEEFVNKINKAYGISTKTIMNAQAVFKNMIGSLGQIDNYTAYKLSEALVQMSADFSSLYNVQLESALQKMQAMLAGQVRPIRSAGLDVTETTLYQYYQAIGGTKTMRQLNRTEKQLLSILAVYRQMGSAGALGDMTKTLNQFANQSRMMTEYWEELKAWTGLVLKDYLEQEKVLVYINAAIIMMTEIVKGFAKQRGLGEENFIDGMLETTEATNEEIDKLQGKLLDFDKFRSLNEAENNVLGIDSKLLDAIANYSSQIENAKNEAKELAESWLKSFGFIYDAESSSWNLRNNFESISKFVYSTLKNFEPFKTALETIEFWVDNIKKLWEAIKQIIENIDFSRFTEPIDKMGDIIMDKLNPYINLGKGIFNYAKGIFGYANGGLPDKGTVFYAGEAGAEMVYNTPSGQSGVANVQQIAQATYSGTMRALNDWWGGSGAKSDIPKLREANPSGLYQVVTGVAKSQGKVWAKT